MKRLKYWLILGSPLSPLSALAQGSLNPDCNGSVNILCGQNWRAGSLFQEIIGILLGIVGLISVLFIIIGGFRYITSAGNEEQAEAGKKTLQNAIIGLVVVILCYVIVNVIINMLTGNGY
jgi:glucose uptake protein GlcU